MSMSTKTWLWLALLAATACAKADPDLDAGKIEISQAWVRETPPNAPVAAGYLSIRNQGTADDRLVKVASTAAERVEIHEIRHEDGVARMREMTSGLPLPAGSTVELKPGGYHLMLIGPARPFRAGDVVAATLVFEHGDERKIEFEVRGTGAAKKDDAHAHH